MVPQPGGPQPWSVVRLGLWAGLWTKAAPGLALLCGPIKLHSLADGTVLSSDLGNLEGEGLVIGEGPFTAPWWACRGTMDG